RRVVSQAARRIFTATVSPALLGCQPLRFCRGLGPGRALATAASASKPGRIRARPTGCSTGRGSTVPSTFGTLVGQRGREAICGFAALGLIANLHGASGRSERHARAEGRESRSIRRATRLYWHPLEKHCPPDLAQKEPASRK